MFEIFDAELTNLSNSNNDDYFYDDAFIGLKQKVDQFTNVDYQQLLNIINNKSDRYKEYLAYIISDVDIDPKDLINVLLTKI